MPSTSVINRLKSLLYDGVSRIKFIWIRFLQQTWSISSIKWIKTSIWVPTLSSFDVPRFLDSTLNHRCFWILKLYTVFCYVGCKRTPMNYPSSNYRSYTYFHLFTRNNDFKHGTFGRFTTKTGFSSWYGCLFTTFWFLKDIFTFCLGRFVYSVS